MQIYKHKGQMLLFPGGYNISAFVDMRHVDLVVVDSLFCTAQSCCGHRPTFSLENISSSREMCAIIMAYSFYKKRIHPVCDYMVIDRYVLWRLSR